MSQGYFFSEQPLPSPIQNPFTQHQSPAQQNRPLGRYCGHVFLYWDPDHFQKAAARGKTIDTLNKS